MLGLHCLGCEYNGLEIVVPLFAVSHQFDFGVPCAYMCVHILRELFRVCDNIVFSFDISWSISCHLTELMGHLLIA